MGLRAITSARLLESRGIPAMIKKGFGDFADVIGVPGQLAFWGEQF
jgi:hypothetical protein